MCSALIRAVDLPKNESHNADVVAPMIRDVGLVAMGQTAIEVLSAQMGKSESYGRWA